MDLKKRRKWIISEAIATNNRCVLSSIWPQGPTSPWLVKEEWAVYYCVLLQMYRVKTRHDPTSICQGRWNSQRIFEKRVQIHTTFFNIEFDFRYERKNVIWHKMPNLQNYHHNFARRLGFVMREGFSFHTLLHQKSILAIGLTAKNLSRTLRHIMESIYFSQGLCI